MWHFYRELVRSAENMSVETYVMLAVVGIAIGLLCLRGFGSRSRY